MPTLSATEAHFRSKVVLLDSERNISMLLLRNLMALAATISLDKHTFLYQKFQSLEIRSNLLLFNRKSALVCNLTTADTSQKPIIRLQWLDGD